MIFLRTLQKTIESRLFSGKVIVIYGARQVGKTTLVKNIIENCSSTTKYLNADNPSVRESLSNKDALELKYYIGDYKLVVIDEAQRIENIGLTLKLLVDTYPSMQIIATGSSSFELANKISEPLTGRSWVFHLMPLSLQEITADNPENNGLIMNRMLRFGSYPNIWNMSNDDAALSLTELTSNYLFRDLLEHESLKKAPLLTKLLRALALQLGNEVSLRELSNTLEVDLKTIERYLFLLEQTFILYRLPPLKRNKRSEVGKLRKIYFYDLGLRNALISSFNNLDQRLDVGALWENFCIIERVKYLTYLGKRPNYYFWRSYSQKEVDLIEEIDGKFNCYEFKWKSKSSKMPHEFNELYPGSNYTEVSAQNFTNILFNFQGGEL